jgi:hypothetical protein
MTEQEYVEYLYHLQHARGLLELCEKTQDTMRRAVKWTDPYTWPVRKQVDKYVTGQYEPKVKNSRTQYIGLVQLMVGKYQKIEVISNTNRFVASLTPMRIEHALLHPRVNGPTRASKTYNAWKPQNTLNWCGTFGAENKFVLGTEHVNAVSKNHYTSVLPGYLSIKSEYTKLSCMIPSPTQILREPTKNKMYCVYVAFEGKVPQNEDKQFNYNRPMEQVFYTTMEKTRTRKKSQDICKSVHTLNEEWLFDTGATVHITPNMHVLLNTSICCREIKVANGRLGHVR